MPQSQAMAIYHDNGNVSKTYHYVNPILQSYMKNLKVDSHFIHNLVQVGALCVIYISSRDQLMDVLNKPLLRAQFLFLRSKIGISI